ncbi:MAG: ABC transporter ATP-binding protein [Azospirillaceae bacterium]
MLTVRDLGIAAGKGAGRQTLVQDLSFEIHPGEVLALVGESGCGKTMTALSIAGLLPPRVEISGGQLKLLDQALAGASERTMNRVRGRHVGMIFQEPMTSLNPVLTIGTQLTEGLIRHLGMSGQQARARAIELLDLVRIADAPRRLRDYPHHLSGGLRQRVMIAMALACQPALLLADEPTTALDVTIQAQILELLEAIRRELGTAILLITHDLGVVADIADRAMVMYAGRVVETAGVDDLLNRPQHPYTRGLIKARPELASALGAAHRQPLQTMPGMVPRGGAGIAGCAFRERCPLAMARCAEERPPLEPRASGHAAACWATL